ncbi:MAG: sugar phosphate isomerase/epimerase [Planctomycetes bacterium]|nr:sugar phosphate isomerase/epimerase [Planctomycetota bacterium]
MSSIEAKIGVSTIVLYERPEWDMMKAIEEVSKAGFKGFEIHLDDFHGCIGDPWMIRFPGVWPRTCSASFRRELKDALKVFETVTLHGTCFEVNIAAENPGLREEGVRQYVEALEFAAELGIPTVTFHMGGPAHILCDPEKVYARNLEFAKRATAFAEKHGLSIGYENGGSIDLFKRYIKDVNSPAFGLLWDIGHATMHKGGNTGVALRWAEAFRGQMVEIHAHNVLGWTANMSILDHHGFEEGTFLDMRAIFRKVKQIGYDRPIIFEILGPRAHPALDKCKRAKEIILDVWDEA